MTYFVLAQWNNVWKNLNQNTTTSISQMHMKMTPSKGGHVLKLQPLSEDNDIHSSHTSLIYQRTSHKGLWQKQTEVDHMLLIDMSITHIYQNRSRLLYRNVWPKIAHLVDRWMRPLWIMKQYNVVAPHYHAKYIITKLMNMTWYDNLLFLITLSSAAEYRNIVNDIHHKSINHNTGTIYLLDQLFMGLP